MLYWPNAVCQYAELRLLNNTNIPVYLLVLKIEAIVRISDPLSSLEGGWVKCLESILPQLASCLIYAKPFRHPFRGNPAPISVLVWMRSFIEPDVLRTKVDNTSI